MPNWKLRGRKPLRSNEESQSINIPSASNSNCLSNSSDLGLPLRPYSKRRRLNGCTVRDISISQSRDTLSGGVPQFIVQIYNTCTTGGCAPSKVHVNCGWFASRVLVNPSIFQRLAYNDCLVNAGHPLQRGQILRFTYQNSFMYPLSFKSAQFC
ncbi:hypothetical protein KP509_05G007900 [Ceratopteris richardii]|nr:hypothetical protein KP509_05G007900 [Ceratopteris richardii]